MANVSTDTTQEVPNVHPAASRKVSTGGIHYHCSAAHLKLASKTFEKSLSGDWAESIRKDDGRYHIVVEDWDENALLTLLNIFHLKTRQLPEEMDDEKLTKLAVLMDYYDCAETTGTFTDVWLDRMRNRVPSTYCRELILWICVFAVLGKKRNF